MADLANLILAVDSTQVKAGTTALDGLTAAGARAEAASAGLRGGLKGAGAEASALAAGAQVAARAAMDQAAGFKASANAAHLNTLAMRETLVVARELSRGNFTRLPGSLTLLAQGVGSQGGLGAYASALANQFGLIRKVQDAELAEQAVAASSAAAAVRNAAQRAAANVIAADTEIALAEAQLRVTAGTSAEGAAQARLAVAHQAVAAAAGEAAIAENALALAMGREAEAQAASAAATRTLIGGGGIGLIGLGVSAGVAYAAIKEFQDQVRDSGVLDKYAGKLNLTDAEIKKMGGSVTYLGHNIKEVHGLTVSFGDVAHGVFQELARELSDSGPWSAFASNAKSAFDYVLQGWSRVSAGISASLDVMKVGFGTTGKVFGGIVTGNPRMLMQGVQGFLSGPQVSWQDAYAAELKKNQDTFSRIGKFAIDNAKKRIKEAAEGNNPPRIGGGRRGVGGHAAGAAEADPAKDQIARLDEQILSAKIALTKDVAEEAKLKVEQLRIERDKTISDAQQLYAKHKITAAELDALKYRAEQLDNLKEQAAFDARDIALNNQQNELRQQSLGFQIDDLKAQQASAETADQRRKVQLDILALEYEQKKSALQIAENNARIAHNPFELQKTLAEEARLPKQYALNRKAVNDNNLNPLQAWAKSAPHDAATITEALQGIEARGLDRLANGLTDVITGAKSLGAVFRDVSRSIISEIIQMTVRMLIFRAISSAFGGGSLGASGASISVPGISGARASGGPVGMGQTYLVGEQGPELFRPAQSGTIVPNHRLNDNRSGPVEVKISFGSAPEFAPYVEAVSTAAGQRAVQVSVQHTNNTIRQIIRPKLQGR